MLKINAIKIIVHSTDGQYGFDATFADGLNIVRGDNSAGKSTIFQAILYALGMEELIGARNDKAMQSVLKNEILNSERVKVGDVIESSVFLEIQNEHTITIERYIKGENRNPKLVRVYYGSLLTGKAPDLRSDLMYVHDAGAATDVTFGFFAFLEKFLGVTLPEVQYNDGAIRKLYLQNIFPCFVIEQKVGWSDFLATIPFYNLRDKEKRAIEFILKLDSWNIEEKKQEIGQLRQSIEASWFNTYSQIKELARRAASQVNGLEEKPSILESANGIFLSLISNEKQYHLNEFVNLMTEQLVEIEEKEIPKIQEISKEKEIELSTTTERYNLLTVQHNELSNRKNILDVNINSIEERLKQIEEELVHNKHHLKVKKLALDNNLSLASDLCPTCNQSIVDSLLPQNELQNPMNIEQNIAYLDSQKSMARTYLDAHRKEMSGIEQLLNSIEISLIEHRTKIRAIKKDLISDDRLPSVELIERRIKLKNKIDFYTGVQNEFDKLLSNIVQLGVEWKNMLIEHEKLPKDSFSKTDHQKMKYLNEEFIRLLKKLDYGSKSLADLSISKDKLIPVAEGQYNIKYNMRLDSSASDLVRAIAAYTCSLYTVSEKFDTNHPRLIMMDEPGTQETAISTLRQLLLELQGYKAQSIIFASFKQSDNDFIETTTGIKFNLIKSTAKKFIVKHETHN
jgi:hypothetical protein